LRATNHDVRKTWNLPFLRTLPGGANVQRFETKASLARRVPPFAA
jgi:hypothetical protein